MSRSPRVVFPGAIYHVMSRGNGRKPIYTDDIDRRVFLRILQDVIHRYNVICHAYCMMVTHYHLVLETPDGNLSRAMQLLNGAYGRAFNRRHGRVGHLFQGRFRDVLVEKQSYLLELSRYVVLNPVRGELVTLPHEWLWSSFRATAGLARRPDFLCVDWILRCFDEVDRPAAQRRYVEFVLQGIDQLENIAERLRRKQILGRSEFVTHFRAAGNSASQRFQEVARARRFAGRPALATLLGRPVDRHDRDRLILKAHQLHGYTISEIAKYLGIHRTTASKAIDRTEKRQFTL
jgi:putative transposase